MKIPCSSDIYLVQHTMDFDKTAGVAFLQSKSYSVFFFSARKQKSIAAFDTKCPANLRATLFDPFLFLTVTPDYTVRVGSLFQQSLCN